MRESNFSLNLRRLLEDKGWTIAELARRAGLDYSLCHRHVHGNSKFIAHDTLLRIRGALGVRLEELYR